MIIRYCDKCRKPDLTTKRYGIVPTNTRTMRGGIDLCDPCWQTHAEPRMARNGGYTTRGASYWKKCTICQEREGRRVTLRSQFRVGRDHKIRGAGGITLCMPCWDLIAKPSTREYHIDKRRGIRRFVGEVARGQVG